MNSCVLMVEIVQNPQLRYTPEQTALAEMLVQFPGLRAEDPPATLKVVGWGNLAQEIQQNYHQGDRVIIEGRLSMNTVERSEGFKEKRAELTVQRIHSLGAGVTMTSSTGASDSTDYLPDSRQEQVAARKAKTAQANEASQTPIAVTASDVDSSSTPDAPRYQSPKPQSPYPSSPNEGQDLDDIPF